MSISHYFYQLLIQPLELLLEIVYGYSMKYVHNPALAIVFMSLVMNLLLLPLYRRTDAIQEQEREREKRMEHFVSHIKKTFRGDERFMMLQTYYRQNNYKPAYALKGLLPLVLEIPFFIAAYHFLSHLEMLQGASFLGIADLSRPDALLSLGGRRINCLPVLMTLINFASSAIYTKGQKLKDKAQLYAMALVFLVLLYNSPSGLVIYWTLNNLFSLVKNAFVRMRRGRQILLAGVSALGGILLVYALAFSRGASAGHRALLAAAALVLELPLLGTVLKKRGALPRLHVPEEDCTPLFFFGSVLMTLLTGVLIPSSVIVSSPSEFINLADFQSPLLHVLNAFLLAAGFFLVWFSIFYYLTGRETRWVFSFLLWLVCGAAVVDYMFFATDPGLLSDTLRYSRAPVFSVRERLVNLAVLLVLVVGMSLLWKKKRVLVRGLYGVLVLAVFGMAMLNIFNIQRAVPAIRQSIDRSRDQEISIPLSRDGKNVVVLMLDRAISAFLPCFMQERPELEAQFDGFVYYPNTLSFGAHTNTGSPALYGGYEYRPENINARSDEPLVKKQNEALRVMPLLFSGAGYEVTVCDASLANYRLVPDLSIYDDRPEIHTFLTESGQIVYLPEGFMEAMDHLWERNFFCYGIMKSAPLFLQKYIYQNGSYFDAYSYVIEADDPSAVRNSVNRELLYGYSALHALPEITRITDDQTGAFLMMANSTSHAVCMLREPEYEPAVNIDNSEYDEAHRDRFTLDGETLPIMESSYAISHYETNMAALIQLGRWFDMLREEGVYDNTRIIIVSDHGQQLYLFDGQQFGPGEKDNAMFYNPLLLVKDFDSHGFTTDRRFMTNADTPTLAMEGLITDPVNPATGNPVSDAAKTTEPLHVFASHDYQAEGKTGNTFEPAPWYTVSGDVRDAESWTLYKAS